MPARFMALQLAIAVSLLASTSCSSTKDAPTGADQKSAGIQSREPALKAPAFTLPDTRGKLHSLSDYTNKFVVLEWINFGCPFIKKHYNSGNMQVLQRWCKGRGIIWLSVCSSAPGKHGHLSNEAVEAKLKEFKASPTAYLFDPSGQTGRAYNAKTTPHMFVIDPLGLILYSGAIDDRPSTDEVDMEGAVNYVKSAIEGAMGGQAGWVSSSKPYGCPVKY